MVKQLFTFGKQLIYRSEEQYIIDESDEITVAEDPGWARHMVSAFPALSQPDYRLYFIGQIVSLSGTWMQIVALGWLALELTHSAFWVGVVATTSTLPVFFFTLIAGVIVDRYSKKHILIIVQSVALCVSFLLAILTYTGAITIWQMLLCAFVLGVVEAFDRPARHSYIVELVGKKHLSSAVALNAFIFNTARIIGPAIAGILIGLFGTSGAFFVNALTYSVLISALLRIHTMSMHVRTHPHPIESLKQGLAYAFSHPIIRIILLFVGITSICGWSQSTLMPVIVKQIYHQEAFSLGYFYGATAVGALISSVLVSLYFRTFRPWFFILGGNMLFSVSMIAFTFQTQMVFALLFLLLSGLGIIVQFATMNSYVQDTVPDAMRGRIMSIYTLMFIGLTPIGNFLYGFLAQALGALQAIYVGSLILILGWIGIFLLLLFHKYAIASK